ncbi:hypothetical protein [Burkholderia stagnalis]|uniref:hypothetical protein n=1 Tax=Burkholderia stagnalis TaxID=1503054 RepID=UPI00075C196B|nr:hypothetical protein [Burkholderia stagnalis]KVL90763.1 hypothetical protein WT02_23125 [Burkholderia stagnalis]KVL93737.1 hypothetical protein WT03_14930 [Burkholderia stagnalis]KVM02160.1 hypothetical protein WT04_30690 [Burkholderia stagnalis]
MADDGGGSSQSQTTTSDLPAWALPYAKDLLQRSSDLSKKDIPQYDGKTVADLNQTQTGAIQGLTNAAGNQAGTAGAAMDYYRSLTGNPNGFQISNPFTGNVTASTVADKFADPANNPYLAQTVDASNRAITDAYQNGTAASTMAQFRNAGAFGGSAQQQVTSQNEQNLGRTLSENTSNMYNSAYNTAANVATQNAAQRNAVNLANQSVGTAANTAYNSQASQNYQNQQGNILGALGTATGANAAASSLSGNQMAGGAVAQGNDQDKLNAMYQAWFNRVNQPYQQLGILSKGLAGAIPSGAGTTTTTGTTQSGGGSMFGTAMGLGQMGLGFAGMF